MVGWHHRHSGHGFEQALGVGDGQGVLACCSPRGCKESDTTEQLNWTECLTSFFCSQSQNFYLFRGSMQLFSASGWKSVFCPNFSCSTFFSYLLWHQLYFRFILNSKRRSTSGELLGGSQCFLSHCLLCKFQLVDANTKGIPTITWKFIEW